MTHLQRHVQQARCHISHVNCIELQDDELQGSAILVDDVPTITDV